MSVPLCIDCKHYQGVRNQDFTVETGFWWWKRIKHHSGSVWHSCRYPHLDIVTGARDHMVPMSCSWNRSQGPCGWQGKLWEPKT